MYSTEWSQKLPQCQEYKTIHTFFLTLLLPKWSNWARNSFWTHGMSRAFYRIHCSLLFRYTRLIIISIVQKRQKIFNVQSDHHWINRMVTSFLLFAFESVSVVLSVKKWQSIQVKQSLHTLNVGKHSKTKKFNFAASVIGCH